MEKSVGDDKKDAVFLHLFCISKCTIEGRGAFAEDGLHMK